MYLRNSSKTAVIEMSYEFNGPWQRFEGFLPSWVEVSEGVGDVTDHPGDDGPFTAQILDHDWRQEHGGDDDGGVDDAQRGHAHPILRIQAALCTGRDEATTTRRRSYFFYCLNFMCLTLIDFESGAEAFHHIVCPKLNICICGQTHEAVVVCKQIIHSSHLSF